MCFGQFLYYMFHTSAPVSAISGLCLSALKLRHSPGYSEAVLERIEPEHLQSLLRLNMFCQRRGDRRGESEREREERERERREITEREERERERDMRYKCKESEKNRHI